MRQNGPRPIIGRPFFRTSARAAGVLAPEVVIDNDFTPALINLGNARKIRGRLNGVSRDFSQPALGAH
jgi:hypothetical protein